MLKTLTLRNFTVFRDVTVKFLPGINVIIGQNSSGKTHLMQVAYSVLRPNNAQRVRDQTKFVSQKLVDVFLPEKHSLGSLVARPVKGDCEINLGLHDYLGDSTFTATLDFNSKKNFKSADAGGFKPFSRRPVFIPTKEVLSFIHVLATQYEFKEPLLSDTYNDLCEDLDEEGPEQEEDLEERAQWALEQIKELCKGEFFFNDGHMVFKAKNNETHANRMIAEGYRKLGVLYHLLRNGTLSPSVSGPLFWDEPDANLNPGLLRVVVQILLELCRNGQQIILSTHNYVLLKELEIARRSSDQICFHALSRDANDDVEVKTTSEYAQIQQNAIADTYTSLYDRDLSKALGGLGQ